MSSGLLLVTPTAADDDRLEYLRALAGRAPMAHFLEVRYRVGEDVLASAFFSAHDRESAARFIGERARRTDVYVGCAPRSRQSGTRNDIEQVWALWAECDGAAAATAALSYRPAPSIVIRSGSGHNLHAYWPLERPLAPAEAEIANLRLAHAVGADRACFDAARILRPPATWNHKHDPPTPVAAVRVEPTERHDLEAVLARAPDIAFEHIERRWDTRPGREPGRDGILRIPPAIYVSALLGVTARAGRKVSCPFHADVRPSLHVYAAASRGWSCFSCRRGGSIYDLAAELWGMETRGRDFVRLRRQLEARFAPEISGSRCIER